MNSSSQYFELETSYGMWNEEYGESIEDFFIDPDPFVL